MSRVHLQADHVAKTALPDRFFDGFEQIVGLQFLDRHLGVARDVEDVRRARISRPGNRWCRLAMINLLQPDEAVRARPQAAWLSRHRHQLRQAVGHLHAREVLGPLPGSRTATAIFKLRLEICGNGRPGSKASGVRTGKTLSAKNVSSCARCSSAEFVQMQQANVILLQRREADLRDKKSYAPLISRPTARADGLQSFRAALGHPCRFPARRSRSAASGRPRAP